MPHLRKSDVQTRNGYPCVRVKALMWPHPQLIADRLNIDEDTAEHASRLAYESACESFWEDWRDVNRYPQPVDRPYFDHPVYVYQDGRQRGWLYITGLPAVETWDAVMLAKWARFQRDVEADVAYRCSLDTIAETIEANQWTDPGAERYNLIGTPERNDAEPATRTLRSFFRRLKPALREEYRRQAPATRHTRPRR